MKIENIKSAIILLMIIVLNSCTSKDEDKMTKAYESQTKNIEMIQKYFEYFNHHDWTSMAGMYIDTADFKDPSLGEGIVKQTREETIAKYSQLNEYFPDIHDEVIKMYPSGEEHIIVEFISTGTGPDQSTFQLPICTIFTIVNGKITSDYTYYDNFEE